MLRLILLSVFFIIIVQVKAQAAFLVEPVLGHNFGAKADVGGGGGDYSGGKGLGYGGRLGYQKLGFSVGVDYLHSNLDMGDSDFSEKLKTNEYSGFVGVKLPILLKFYAGYIVNADAKSDYRASGATTSLGLRTSSGHGFKVGAGWTLFPLVDINLEYRKLTFDDYKIGGVKNTGDIDLSAWLFSVSVPLTF